MRRSGRSTSGSTVLSTTPERTADGRYVVIDGRRWRATDPDLPSNRYKEIAPKVQALCAEYDLPYTTGPLGKQYATVLRRIARLSLPTPVREAVAEAGQERAAA